MFSHITIGSNDIAKAKGFYDGVTAALGLTRHADYPDGIGYGRGGGRPQLWVVRPLDKKGVSSVISDVYENHGKECTINFLDDLKAIGFKYAMKAGITIAMTDMDIPGKRDEIIHKAEEDVKKIMGGNLANLMRVPVPA